MCCEYVQKKVQTLGTLPNHKAQLQALALDGSLGEIGALSAKFEKHLKQLPQGFPLIVRETGCIFTL